MKVRQPADHSELDLAPLDAKARETFARERSLAFLVEALAAKYRPRVVSSVRLISGGDDEELFRFINGDEDPPGLRQIELPSDAFVRQADQLLFAAKNFDPLGAWSEVVRMADPRRWDDLRYDALIAHDYRIAAEFLLGYVEDQARLGIAEPLNEPPRGVIHPRYQRLPATDRERSEIVMRFGISDRPAMVLAVEGHAEYEIAPRVLEMLGYDPLASRIRIVNLQSIKGDVKLLARAVAVPRLGIDGDRYSPLFSPLTALMVVVDPEPPYQSPDNVEAKKKEMIDSVLDSLAPPHRNDAIRSELQEVLHVYRWPEEFEFANWTDSELAEALQEVSPDAAEIPCEELENRIGKHRAAGDAIKQVWNNWQPRPSKARLARALWPALERRIRATAASEEIPIVHMIEEAISIAHSTHRVNAMAPPATSP